jgi:hypothetical protein
MKFIVSAKLMRLDGKRLADVEFDSQSERRILRSIRGRLFISAEDLLA